MKFFSVFALLALTLPTVVLSQDGDTAADVAAAAATVDDTAAAATVDDTAAAAAATVPDCDCSSKIQAHLADVVAQRDAISSSLVTVQSQHDDMVAKVAACTATLATPKTPSSPTKAEYLEYKKQVTQMETELLADYNSLQETLRETSVATKLFKEREGTDRKELTNAFNEYKERKDEFNKYILEHKEKTEALYEEILLEMAKPGPMVNFARICEDLKNFVRSLFNIKQEEVKDESSQAESSSQAGGGAAFVA